MGIVLIEKLRHLFCLSVSLEEHEQSGNVPCLFVISSVLFQKSSMIQKQIYRNFSFTQIHQPRCPPIRINKALTDTCFLRTSLSQSTWWPMEAQGQPVNSSLLRNQQSSRGMWNFIWWGIILREFFFTEWGMTASIQKLPRSRVYNNEIHDFYGQA